MPQYQVGYVYTDHGGQPGAWACYRIHSDGAAAAAELKRLAAAHPFADGRGYRWSIKRCRDDGLPEDWREREQARFDNGTYERVPWHGAEWANKHADHFVHLSTEEPGKLAFTEDAKKGEADRQTRILPGRYLKRFYGDVLSDDEIEELACEVTIAAGAFTLKITQDPDEIEAVYENGPNSCMSGDADNFSGPCHPARVYAGPDLALAYLGTLDEPTGRVVVWPEKKRYTSIYGNTKRLRMLLEAQGYQSGCFDGARVRKIMSSCGEYVMPYVDGASGASVDGDYIVLGRGWEIETSNTHGLGGPAGASCDRCGDRYDDENEGYSVGDERWCDHCGENYSTYCEVTEETYADPVVTVTVHASDWSTRYPSYWTNVAGIYGNRTWTYQALDGVLEGIEHSSEYEFYPDRNDGEGEWWHRRSAELATLIADLAVALSGPQLKLDLPVAA